MKNINSKYMFTILLYIAFVAGCNQSSGTTNVLNEVCFQNKCFTVEVARTQQERSKGLQDRKSMGRDHGMLFVFSKSYKHSFWMKDTYIALDMIWLNEHKKIVTILSNILPCTTEQCPVYAPDKNALYVLELNAGMALETGLKVGDQAIF